LNPQFGQQPAGRDGKKDQVGVGVNFAKQFLKGSCMGGSNWIQNLLLEFGEERRNKWRIEMEVNVGLNWPR
jgi:hypothetical protein